MSLTFAIEKLIDVWPELVMLHKQHWFETEAYRHGQPFDPRLDRYLDYEQADWFIVFTARDGEKLVGNLTVYLTPSMHTQQLIASEDTLFLLPEYRKGRNAIGLIQFAEAECWKRGAVEMTVTSKNDKTGRLMMHLDYELVAVEYSKQRAPTEPSVSLDVGESHAISVSNAASLRSTSS